MSTYRCWAIERVCPPKDQKTWSSGYWPLVLLRICTVSTFRAGGMAPVSPQKEAGGGSPAAAGAARTGADAGGTAAWAAVPVRSATA